MVLRQVGKVLVRVDDILGTPEMDRVDESIHLVEKINGRQGNAILSAFLGTMVSLALTVIYHLATAQDKSVILLFTISGMILGSLFVGWICWAVTDDIMREQTAEDARALMLHQLNSPRCVELMDIYCRAEPPFAKLLARHNYQLQRRAA